MARMVLSTLTLALVQVARGHACGRYYIDLGTNVGHQVHKLYHPQQCADAGVQPLFGRHFGTSRHDVCTIGVEPNPKHARKLAQLERHYTSQGTFVRIINAAAGLQDGTAVLSMNENEDQGEKHNFWMASLASGAAASTPGAVNVTTVDVGAMLSALPKDAKVVMKMDVEGAEVDLLPAWVKSQALCRVSEVYIETHGESAEKALNAARKDLRAAGCATVLTWMDDEAPCNPLDMKADRRLGSMSNPDHRH